MHIKQALHSHVLESNLLSDDKGDLGELCGKEKTVGVAEDVLRSADANISEERKCLDMPVLVSWCCTPCPRNIGEWLDL